jgi:hypothetical protein
LQTTNLAPTGGYSAFVTELNPTGTGLGYSTYLGGNNNTLGWGIAVDAVGHAYVTGYTAASNFPTTPGAFQTADPAPAGSNTGFVASFDLSVTPAITSLSPNSGPAAGGTVVTITGANFIGATAVSFGGTAASFTVNSATQITATSPAGSGIVDIRVTSPNGTSAISTADQFTYVAPPPAVTSVTINGGPIAAIDAFGNTPNLTGQNSIVEQLLVTFNESVTLDDGAFAITNLWQQVTVNSGAQPNRLAVSVTPNPVPGSNNTQFVLTFSGPGATIHDNTATGTGGIGGVLTTIMDGFYQLNVDGSKVHANGLTAANDNTNFWALYGVATAGIGVAGIDEFILDPHLGNGQSEAMIGSGGTQNIYAAYGSESDVAGPPIYIPMYDVNLDGAIDSYDLQKFYENFNTDWAF